MALRRVRGVLAIENQETGDGRVMAPGSLEWSPLPLPLAWLRDGDQHINLTEVAPQIGTIATITRAGDLVEFTGHVDDENPDGAEVIRRMEAGTAPLGERFGLSIDPDSWEVEIILTEPDEDDAALLVASGQTALPAPRALARSVTAAAGDPDPGDDGGDGVVLFEDASGAILERYTRLRIRGATCCAVAAFDGAFLELDGEATDEPAEPDAEAVAAGAVDGAPALVRGLVVPDRIPDEWYADVASEPDGSLNIEEGWFSGYVAAWDSCHTGFTDRCVPPPREAGNYERFHTGGVELESGGMVSCGVFTWNAPHAALSDSMIRAQEHYAHSACAFGRARVGTNEHGIWHTGALMPGTTRGDLAALRAPSMSGDWRWDQDVRSLRLIAALAVNYPGFVVQRRTMAAAAKVPTIAQLAPEAFMDGNGRILSLTSAGMLAPAGASSCSCHEANPLAADVAAIRSSLSVLDRRTRHLIPEAVAAAATRVR